MREAKCETLIDHWEDILTESDPMDRLELALGLISDYVDGSRLRSGRLSEALDSLAEELTADAATALRLVDILFTQGRFTGNRINYYAPENSSLLSVLNRGEGNPISLACLFILVGRRLGFKISGCNYPGHFLSLIPRGESPILVDCFNAGQLVSADDLVDSAVAETTTLSAELFKAASAEVILLRVLRNLERAFHQAENEHERGVFEHLIERMLVSGMV
jgi:regulator of sirC expression with transglutaminase-like and TPR domain